MPRQPMQLHYTPRSHFSRKVRLVLAALGLQATLVDVGNVADAGDRFGPDPMRKVPTLVDGDQVVFEADHVAAYPGPGNAIGAIRAGPGRVRRKEEPRSVCRYTPE